MGHRENSTLLSRVWVSGFGSRVQDFSFRVSGFRVQNVEGSGFWFQVQDFWLRVSGSGFQAWDFGFRFLGFGLRV